MEKTNPVSAQTKTNLLVSFSGGRTSAYMTKMLLDKYKDVYNIHVVFANTGLEHPNTLDFIRKCDVIFGFNTVWLESVVHHGERKSCTYKVVTYETASRNGEPFEEVIKKYGIPNKTFMHCTRELKMNPIKAYARDLKLDSSNCKMVVGIRKDEMNRVSNEKRGIPLFYPLITEFPVDKQDVLDWWEDQPFDLELDEHNGNCVGCYKKSLPKLFAQLDDDSSAFDFHKRMEKEYGYHEGTKTQRVFFRGNTSAERLISAWQEDRDTSNPIKYKWDIYGDSGCTESCEAF